MGEAKRRGTYEERKAAAIKKKFTGGESVHRVARKVRAQVKSRVATLLTAMGVLSGRPRFD